MYSTRISVVVLFLSALVCDRYGVVKSMRGNIGLAQLGSCGRGMLLLLAIGCLRLTVAAQSFSNLNFESTAGLGIPADGIWLNWSLAAPGWHHPSGGDSVFVYHKDPPRGSIAQYYFLVDSTATSWSPLEGQYSLALVSGHYNRNDSSSPWVNAYIEQTGYIPLDAQSLQLFAKGEFELTINSKEVPISTLEGDLYGADISRYAGQTVSMRISSTSTQVQTPVIVDGLNFSPQAIPEPSGAALLVIGLAAGILAKRRRAAPICETANPS